MAQDSGEHVSRSSGGSVLDEKAANSTAPDADQSNNSDVVLVVDDDAIVRSVISMRLKHHGFEVMTASSGKEAMQLCKTKVPDIILLDVQMPEMDGFEVCQALKRDPETSQVPVIFVTASDAKEQKLRGFDVGGADYVSKNADDKEIIARISSHTCIAKLKKELELSYKELAVATRLESIGQLAAGIAHEINTPIQFVGDNNRFLKDAFDDLDQVMALCEKMAQDCDEPAAMKKNVLQLKAMIEEADIAYMRREIPKAIEQSAQGVHHVAEIVRAMKAFSHPASGEKTLTDINKAIETTMTVCYNEWKYVAEVKTELDPSLEMVNCFPGELNQVFLNLIVNAAHAIAERPNEESASLGSITIRTRRVQMHCEISISDTGQGIAEDVQPRIFDPFFTTKEVGKGTGQGLAIAHQVVVDRHGGALTFETEVGKGTTFVVRIPYDLAMAA